MVMPGNRGYALKCEKCGYLDIAVFQDRCRFLSLAELTFKLKGRKCPKCGEKMSVDPRKPVF
jgi:predicted nucleic-acid-binding Zn-ribbon protein